MKSVEGLEGIKGSDIEDETGTAKGSIKRNEYGDLYDSEMKATPKATPKAAAPKAEAKPEPKAEPKKKASTTIPSTFGKVSLPKSFSASGGNTEPKKSTARLSPVSLPDPLAKFKKTKGDKDTAYSDAGYKKGGMVSSASKRADGCVIRGKTRA
jgi:hypothetical protein